MHAAARAARIASLEEWHVLDAVLDANSANPQPREVLQAVIGRENDPLPPPSQVQQPPPEVLRRGLRGGAASGGDKYPILFFTVEISYLCFTGSQQYF